MSERYYNPDGEMGRLWGIQVMRVRGAVRKRHVRMRYRREGRVGMVGGRLAHWEKVSGRRKPLPSLSQQALEGLSIQVRSTNNDTVFLTEEGLAFGA